jgi:hypothetical protein
MLDFTRDTPDDLLSLKASEPAPPNDLALLDAYSNAVIGVTERSAPRSCAWKPDRKALGRVSAAGSAPAS